MLEFYPRIIRFLGYIPFDRPNDTIGQLGWYKRARGLTLIELGQEMKRHPDQLQEWLSGARRPFNKSLRKIED